MPGAGYPFRRPGSPGMRSGGGYLASPPPQNPPRYVPGEDYYTPWPVGTPEVLQSQLAVPPPLQAAQNPEPFSSPLLGAPTLAPTISVVKPPGAESSWWEQNKNRAGQMLGWTGLALAADAEAPPAVSFRASGSPGAIGAAARRMAAMPARTLGRQPRYSPAGLLGV